MPACHNLLSESPVVAWHQAATKYKIASNPRSKGHSWPDSFQFKISHLKSGFRVAALPCRVKLTITVSNPKSELIQSYYRTWTYPYPSDWVLMGSFYAVDIGAEYCEYILAGREGDYTLRGHTFTFTYCKLLLWKIKSVLSFPICWQDKQYVGFIHPSSGILQWTVNYCTLSG